MSGLSRGLPRSTFKGKVLTVCLQLLCRAAKLPMNGTVAVTGYKQGGAMQPPPAAPCTDVHFGSCPVLQVTFALRLFAN